MVLDNLTLCSGHWNLTDLTDRASRINYVKEEVEKGKKLLNDAVGFWPSGTVKEAEERTEVLLERLNACVSRAEGTTFYEQVSTSEKLSVFTAMQAEFNGSGKLASILALCRKAYGYTDLFVKMIRALVPMPKWSSGKFLHVLSRS